MRQLLRNKLFVLAVVALLALSTYSAGFALTALYRNVTGIGNVAFTDETTITAITVTSPTKIKATLTSNANTIALQVYNVELYLDGTYSSVQTISWTAGQIPGTSKNLTFSGLDLSSVVGWGIEVVK